MQKKLIALAIAGALTAPLAAQAEVKLSGVLQAELVNVDGDAARPNGLYVQDGSNITGGENSHNVGTLAFSASEDLGNGLKGVAKYALSISNDGTEGDRDAYLGLSGGFGTVLAGRMNTPYKSLNWDPLNGTFMQARGNYGSSAGITGHGGYLDNALAYANSFGPVKLVAAIGVDEAAEAPANTDTAGNHATSFSVVAPVGPVELGFAYLDVSEYGTFADDATTMKLSARFKTGALSVLGQYEDRDAGVAGGEATFALVNVAYTMGNTMLSVGLGQNSIDATDADNTYTAVGVVHKFSKTTRVHAGYSSASPDTAADTDENILGVGMRVAF